MNFSESLIYVQSHQVQLRLNKLVIAIVNFIGFSDILIYRIMLLCKRSEVELGRTMTFNNKAIYVFYMAHVFLVYSMSLNFILIKVSNHLANKLLRYIQIANKF